MLHMHRRHGFRIAALAQSGDVFMPSRCNWPPGARHAARYAPLRWTRVTLPGCAHPRRCCRRWTCGEHGEGCDAETGWEAGL